MPRDRVRKGTYNISIFFKDCFEQVVAPLLSFEKSIVHVVAVEYKMQTLLEQLEKSTETTFESFFEGLRYNNFCFVQLPHLLSCWGFLHKDSHCWT